ncbi:MAG: M48 family metallopeptidase [Brachybacterium sp.]|uniref:M48 family metallopeptidase n=1 Tax=Brachybacterium sp. TaxID=1891286 RepID=UPI0026486C86|nr:M48 family metallopeptidase [Brachybacterium sp.]MDN5688529.1 M48 family metallopeptidase [Brachybacterium sp.]
MTQPPSGPPQHPGARSPGSGPAGGLPSFGPPAASGPPTGGPPPSSPSPSFGGPPSGGVPSGPGSPGGPSGPGGPPPSGPSGRPGDPNLVNGATTHGIMGRTAIRHPGELPLLWTGVVLTVLAYIGWTILMLSTVVLRVTEGQQTVDSLWQYVGILPFVIQLVLILPLFPVLVWWARAMMYARKRAMSVRMSPTQFPEGYRMVVEAAQRFGMRRVPDAYVQMGNGVVNAFASGHGFRRFVVINSDLFEVGGQSRDPEALRFVISHEVGHLAAGHVSYFRLVFTNVISMIPILGPAFSRSQEYTADNFGYSIAPAGAPGVMGLLSGGKYLGAEVNVNELADRAATDPSFFIHWANWSASHPVTTWRAHALRDRSKPGSLWIRPSGALYTSPLPPGHVWSSRFPTPGDALAMLEAADRVRPAGASGQFGRFSGIDYSARPPLRAIQTSAPLLSQRTTYAIPAGPYRDDARGSQAGGGESPFAPPGQQGPPAQPPRG